MSAALWSVYKSVHNIFHVPCFWLMHGHALPCLALAGSPVHLQHFHLSCLQSMHGRCHAWPWLFNKPIRNIFTYSVSSRYMGGVAMFGLGCFTSLFTTLSRAVSLVDAWALLCLALVDWAVLYRVKPFHAFSRDYFHGSVSQISGRLVHTIVQGNSLFKVVGQEELFL